MTVAEMKKMARTNFLSKEQQTVDSPLWKTSRNEGYSHPKGKEITKSRQTWKNKEELE